MSKSARNAEQRKEHPYLQCNIFVHATGRKVDIMIQSDHHEVRQLDRDLSADALEIAKLPKDKLVGKLFSVVFCQMEVSRLAKYSHHQRVVNKVKLGQVLHEREAALQIDDPDKGVIL